MTDIIRVNTAAGFFTIDMRDVDIIFNHSEKVVKLKTEEGQPERFAPPQTRLEYAEEGAEVVIRPVLHLMDKAGTTGRRFIGWKAERLAGEMVGLFPSVSMIAEDGEE